MCIRDSIDSRFDSEILIEQPLAEFHDMTYDEIMDFTYNIERDYCYDIMKLPEIQVK